MNLRITITKTRIITADVVQPFVHYVLDVGCQRLYIYWDFSTPLQHSFRCNHQLHSTGSNIRYTCM